MFASENKGVIFLEMGYTSSKLRHHAYIDCIPMPYDLFQDAPLYFKVIFFFLIISFSKFLVIF